tara:strand:- start:448 stop:759 length:312 start_codon:yes stop_codon:yes gene_type:complete
MLENLKEGKEIHTETMIFVLEAALQEEFEYEDVKYKEFEMEDVFNRVLRGKNSLSEEKIHLKSIRKAENHINVLREGLDDLYKQINSLNVDLDRKERVKRALS